MESASRIADEVVLVLAKGSEPSKYAALVPDSVKVTRDRLEGRGPLAGMHAGLEALESDYALVLPCDSPFLVEAVMMLLVTQAKGYDASVPRWPSGHIEPLHSVYRISTVLPAVTQSLDKGDSRADAFLPLLRRVKFVSTEGIRAADPELVTFFNINRQEDMETATRMAGKMTVEH
jgi:molybdopterin-guanine dinucleotide biosynthesis protein A